MKLASILFSKFLPSGGDISAVKMTDGVAIFRKIN